MLPASFGFPPRKKLAFLAVSVVAFGAGAAGAGISWRDVWNPSGAAPRPTMTELPMGGSGGGTAIAAGSSSGMASSGMAVSGNSFSRNSFSGISSPQTPEPTFPKTDGDPVGRVTKRDVAVTPIESPFLFTMLRLNARYFNGQVAITEQRSRFRTGGRRAGDRAESAPRTLWKGPVADAQFVHESAAAVDTLKTLQGAVVWTNKDEIASVDFLLRCEPAGEAKLFGKNGTLLWSGTLTPPNDGVPRGRGGGRAMGMGGMGGGMPRGFGGMPGGGMPGGGMPRPMGSMPGGGMLPMGRGMPGRGGLAAGGGISSQRREGSVQIDSPGVHFGGEKGRMTLTDSRNRTVWSGPMPPQPAILVRNGNSFSYSGKNRASSGMDQNSDIGLDTEKGTITLETTDGKPLGTLPIEILTCRTRMRFTGMGNMAFPVFPRRVTPNLTLSVKGTVLATYRDAAGQVIRRARFYRRVSRTEVSSNGAEGSFAL